MRKGDYRQRNLPLSFDRGESSSQLSHEDWHTEQRGRIEDREPSSSVATSSNSSTTGRPTLNVEDFASPQE